MNFEFVLCASFIILVAIFSGLFVSRTKTASLTDDIIIVVSRGELFDSARVFALSTFCLLGGYVLFLVTNSIVD